MQWLVRFGLAWVGVAARLGAPAQLHAAGLQPAPDPGGASSPIPSFALFALFGGAFLLLSFVLILIGPRNDRRR
ncbi:MAG TPA: hypothetical protein PKD75_03340 [Tepidiformaceae bacterium]|nr:hypothetical protein [Tepidiformaceae bacterium]